MSSVKVIAGDEAASIRRDAEQEAIEVITATVTVHRITTRGGEQKILVESNLSEEFVLIG